MFTRRNFILLILLVFTVVGCQTAEPETVEVPVTVEVTRVVEVLAESEPAESPDLVPVFTTDIRTYSSAATGRDYTVYVILPFSYETVAHSYPVLYITDGDYWTIPTATIAGGLAFEQGVPEVITVGIGYGSTFEVSSERREEDMTPEGSASYLQFLQEELIPDIETNYRADPTVRTLMGHSLGGEFSLYALFNAPDTFTNIIASSPYCGEECFSLEKAYAEGHDALPVRLFASVGGLEEEYLSGFEDFSEVLQATDYDEFVSDLVILDGETHMSAWPRAFTTGMKWVFADWDGTYHLNP